VAELHVRLDEFVSYYNSIRHHRAPGRKTPELVWKKKAKAKAKPKGKPSAISLSR